MPGRAGIPADVKRYAVSELVRSGCPDAAIAATEDRFQTLRRKGVRVRKYYLKQWQAEFASGKGAQSFLVNSYGARRRGLLLNKKRRSPGHCHALQRRGVAGEVEEDLHQWCADRNEQGWQVTEEHLCWKFNQLWRDRLGDSAPLPKTVAIRKQW